MSARYRRPAAKDSSPSPEPAAPLKDVASNAPAAPRLSVVDVLRVLGGLLLLVSGTSYLSTSGRSMTWGYNPWWTRAREWKALANRPIHLTDTELSAYDGSDPQKPIYLALNGTIYDVSASPGTYGPGGSYHFFAGRDAARAFLTGCFAEDTTPDLRGVETMYLPLEPWEREIPGDVSGAERAKLEAERKVAAERFKALTKADKKNRAAQELRRARQSVREGLEHWHVLFRGDKGKPYFKAGEVRREEGWLEKLPKRELCAQAVKQRPVRKYEH